MPLAPLHSTEWLAFTSSPSIKQSPDKAGKLYISRATLTFTSAGQGTATMLRLPPGKLCIYSDLSRVVCPQGTASATLSVGYAAYTNEAGTAVVANTAALASLLTVGSAAQDVVLPLPAGGILEVNSQAGIDITVTIATANSPASGDCIVAIAYTRAG